GGDACALRQRARIAAAELQRDRMLGGVVGQKPRAVAMQHRAGGDHLGVDQRAARQQAMEEPAVPVGPFHHRRDSERTVQCDPPCATWASSNGKSKPTLSIVMQAEIQRGAGCSRLPSTRNATLAYCSRKSLA